MVEPAHDIYIFLAIFARIGTMLMLMPAFGEISVSPRVRLSLALAVTALLYPTVGPLYPAMPVTAAGLAGVVFSEIVVGVLIGGVARILMSGLQIAGSILAFQTGLGFAQNFDPTQGIQGAILGTFLSVVGITLIFVTDLHHLLIGALHGSYIHFKPGLLPALGDSADLILAVAVEAFRLGIILSAPFLVFGLVFYLAMGLLSKLMPQVQVFFIAIPANILLGFAFLLIVIGTMMTTYLAAFEARLMPFAG